MTDQVIAWAIAHVPAEQVDGFVEDYTDYLDELRHPMHPDPFLLSPAAFADLTGIAPSRNST